MPLSALMGVLSGPAHAMAPVKPATSTGESCSFGDGNWVLKSSTEAAAASGGAKCGSFPPPSRFVQSSASFYVINKLVSVIYLPNKTLMCLLPFFFLLEV